MGEEKTDGLRPVEVAVAERWLQRHITKQTQQDIAEELGIGLRSVARYLAKPEVKKYMADRVVELAREHHQEDLLHTLLKKAKEGKNAKYMDIACKVLGLYDPGDKVTVVQNTDIDTRSNDAIREEIAMLKKTLSKGEF